ncbi:MAG: hypothetical protein DI636_08225 [Pelagerythrobacter marensis]|nr:MAG: hypothetical protein DI636_08225 [Pelagerythrobacter marensis]
MAGRNAGVSAWLGAATLVAAAGWPLSAMAQEQPAQPAQSLAERLRALKVMDASGDPAAALMHIDATIAEAEADPATIAEDLLYARAARAGALFWLRRHDEALAIFREVDAALVAAGGPPTTDWSQLINNIGSVLSTQGKLEEAMAFKQRALVMTRALAGEQSMEYASVLYGIALVEYRQGDFLAALPKVEQALEIARRAADANGEAKDQVAIYWLSLSALRSQAGDQTASIAAGRGAALYAEANLPANHRVTMAALHQLGVALNDAGLFGQAEPVLQRALAMRLATLPADDPDLAMSYHAIGFALSGSGRYADAYEYYTKAAEIFSANPDRGNPGAIATSLSQIAYVLRQQGRSDEALAMWRRAVDTARRVSPTPEHRDVALAEANLAAVLVDQGQLAEARPLSEHALAALRRVTLPENPHRVRASVNYGHLLLAEGKPAEALAAAKEGTSAARTMLLDRATPRADRFRLSEQYRSAFVDLARIAFAAGDQAAAFDALQMANLGDLSTAFSALSARGAATTPEQSAALEHYLQLTAEATRLRKTLSSAVGSGDAAAIELANAKVVTADEQLRAADADLSLVMPAFRRTATVEPLPLAQLQARLSPGRTVLVYAEGTGNAAVMAVTRDRVASSVLAGNSQSLHREIEAVRASIEQGVASSGAASFDRQAAHRLYRTLVPDALRPLVEPAARLDILAGGAIASVPFAALVTEPPNGDDANRAALAETAWLIRRSEIAVPLTINAIAAPPARSGASKGFTGIGAPSLAGPPGNADAGPATLRAAVRTASLGKSPALDLPDLPRAEGELRAMAAELPAPHRLLLGAEATEARLRATPLGDAAVIAFATHGLVGGYSRSLTEPALVLTPARDGSEEDGLLTASEVAQMQLSADWIILSACDTSAGDGGGGPVYSGLAQAFFAAGARAMLLSHWRVRDDIAARLTVDTIRHVRAGMGRAAALRRAQLALIDDTATPGAAHPATWAPLIVIE